MAAIEVDVPIRIGALATRNGMVLGVFHGVFRSGNVTFAGHPVENHAEQI